MRIGELTATMEKGKGNQYTKSASSSQDEKAPTKAAALEKANINRNQASQYELMAANPEIVEQVIAEARANDDIVSRVGERQRCGNLHHHSYLGQVEPLQEVSPTQGQE